MTNRIYLRSLEHSDESFMVKLRGEKNIFDYTCGNRYFVSSNHTKKLIEENINNNHKQLYLMICLEKDHTSIGYLSINDVDHINKKVKWGGIVIAPQYSNKGYATDAAKVMLKYIFEEMNINRIYGYWLEDNLASLRMAEKLGFEKEGLLKDYVFKGNKYKNAYICSLLKRDYESNV